MDNNEVYEAPQSEVVAMDKYTHIGGWLRFYQVINIISIVIFGAFFIAGIAFWFLGYYETGEHADMLAALVESIPGIFISIIAVKYLTMKAPETPNKMVKALGYYVTATILIYAVLFYLHKTEQISEKPLSFWGSVIYYYIWLSYFKKSKRVKGYFGANADA